MAGDHPGDAELRVYRMFRRFHRPAPAKLAEVFRLGLPIGMTMIFEAMMFNTMTLVMGRFGADALAAHQIALNFASITFMIPLGIGMASTVRVGMAAGAGDMPAATARGPASRSWRRGGVHHRLRRGHGPLRPRDRRGCISAAARRPISM